MCLTEGKAKAKAKAEAKEFHLPKVGVDPVLPVTFDK
jgi:hypothetical protein